MIRRFPAYTPRPNSLTRSGLTQPTTAQTDSRVFPETGHTVPGLFLA